MSIESADRPITDVIAFFAKFGLEVGFLIPTATGLNKSIMDAHSSLRDYLAVRDVHDYGTQSQGPESKKITDAWLVEASRLTPSRASMYRPVTKAGDPRIWFSGLPSYCHPGNVLAVLSAPEGMYVINASNLSLLESAKDVYTPLGRLIARLRPQENPAAGELLQMLREVAKKGYVPSMRKGPTGVGFTLETLLGIRANSSKHPDFRGIEIKSTRVNQQGNTKVRSTLFGAVPDWHMSMINHASKLLEQYGYMRKGVQRFTCALTNRPNSLGFYLLVDEELDVLHALKSIKDPESVAYVVQWALPRLRKIFEEKHGETFWVKAKTRRISDGSEAFHFYEVQHTMRPLVSNFSPLIQTGHIQFDFTLKLEAREDGSVHPRDHGYLFKIAEENRSLLFPTFATHGLN
jgi:hypothetical protein